MSAPRAREGWPIAVFIQWYSTRCDPGARRMFSCYLPPPFPFFPFLTFFSVFG